MCMLIHLYCTYYIHLTYMLTFDDNYDDDDDDDDNSTTIVWR